MFSIFIYVLSFPPSLHSIGLNDLDIDGEWLVERQALWVVPCGLKEEDSELQCSDQPLFVDPVTQEVFIYKLEDCALKALQEVTVLYYM